MTAEQLIIRRATEFSNPSGDEPAKELGLAGRREFHESVRDLAVGESMAVVFTTRDLVEAQRVGHRGSALRQGQPVTQCASTQVWRRHPSIP